MKNILVIGGTGFVGSALVPALLEAGHAVTLLNRGHRQVKDTQVLVADRDDAAAMARLSAQFDAVIDTSAYTPAQTKSAYASFGVQTDHWIQLSSAAVYQPTEGRFPSEDDTTGGAAIWGDYGVAKSACDDLLLGQSACPVTVLRPPYLYGPKNAYDRETYVWSRALTGRPVIVPGQGDATLQFLHVEDLAELCVRLVQDVPAAHRCFNVADPALISTWEWVEMLGAMTGQELSILKGAKLAPDVAAREYFPFRDTDCALDVAHVQQVLDWAPQYDIEAGFQQTYDSYTSEDLAKASEILDAEVKMLALQ